MKVIHKFNFVDGKPVVINGSYNPVFFAIQNGLITFWCETGIDIDQCFKYEIVATGQPYTGEYCGTVQQDPYIWHIVRSAHNAD